MRRLSGKHKGINWIADKSGIVGHIIYRLAGWAVVLANNVSILNCTDIEKKQLIIFVIDDNGKW